MKIGFITDTNFLKKDNITIVEHTNYLDNINYFESYIEDLKNIFYARSYFRGIIFSKDNGF